MKHVKLLCIDVMKNDGDMSYCRHMYALNRLQQSCVLET